MTRLHFVIALCLLSSVVSTSHAQKTTSLRQRRHLEDFVEEESSSNMSFWQVGTPVYKAVLWGTVQSFEDQIYQISWEDGTTEQYSDVEVNVMVMNAQEQEQEKQAKKQDFLDENDNDETDENKALEQGEEQKQSQEDFALQDLQQELTNEEEKDEEQGKMEEFLEGEEQEVEQPEFNLVNDFQDDEEEPQSAAPPPPQVDENANDEIETQEESLADDTNNDNMDANDEEENDVSYDESSSVIFEIGTPVYEQLEDGQWYWGEITYYQQDNGMYTVIWSDLNVQDYRDAEHLIIMVQQAQDALNGKDPAMIAEAEREKEELPELYNDDDPEDDDDDDEYNYDDVPEAQPIFPSTTTDTNNSYNQIPHYMRKCPMPLVLVFLLGFLLLLWKCCCCGGSSRNRKSMKKLHKMMDEHDLEFEEMTIRKLKPQQQQFKKHHHHRV